MHWKPLHSRHPPPELRSSPPLKLRSPPKENSGFPASCPPATSSPGGVLTCRGPRPGCVPPPAPVPRWGGAAGVRGRLGGSSSSPLRPCCAPLRRGLSGYFRAPARLSSPRVAFCSRGCLLWETAAACALAARVWVCRVFLFPVLLPPFLLVRLLVPGPLGPRFPVQLVGDALCGVSVPVLGCLPPSGSLPRCRATWSCAPKITGSLEIPRMCSNATLTTDTLHPGYPGNPAAYYAFPAAYLGGSLFWLQSSVFSLAQQTV